MIIHCCRNRSSDHHEVKQRYNPTFVHHDIFQAQTPREKQPRFSRTFYSTALDNQGYNIKTIHEKKHKNVVQQQFGEETNVISPDYSHQRRLQDLYPNTRIGYDSKQKWYDHAKQDYLSRVRNCHFTQTLKQRKVMQLSSGPVFMDYDYEPRIKNAITYQSLHREANQNPYAQTIYPQQKALAQANTLQIVPLIGEKQHSKQAKTTQTKNKDSNHEPNLNDQIIKKDSKAILQIDGLQQTKKSKGHVKQSQSSSKPVSKNPMFSLVRGNKIDNHLHRK